MKSIAIVFVFALAGCALGDDDAVTQCRSIHHVDADANSRFTNYGCYLTCYIHGQANPHFMNEGLACPGVSSGGYICSSGQCVAAMKTGHIDIEVTSASLSQSANAYASVCISNSSDPMALPITDRSRCTTCTTNLAAFGNQPIWNNVCAGSGKFAFVQNARLSFELFDHKGTGNNVFLGGATLTIDQLLAHGDNHKTIHLAMTGGPIAGQINTIITWTA